MELPSTPNAYRDGGWHHTPAAPPALTSREIAYMDEGERVNASDPSVIADGHSFFLWNIS